MSTPEERAKPGYWSDVSGIEFRCRRRALGMPTEHIANRLGVRPATVKAWEYGHQPIPQGIIDQLAEWEDTIELLVDNTIEFVTDAVDAGLDPPALMTYQTNADYWQAHPEANPTPPALLHRIAMARAQAELRADGILVRIIEAPADYRQQKREINHEL